MTKRAGIAAAISALLLAGTLGASPARAADPTPTPDPAPTTAPAPTQTKYYVTAYDGTVYGVAPGSIKPLSYSEWAAAGFPAPAPAPTDYVKYPWSPTLYAVTFFGDNPEQWVWRALTYNEWSRAGFPAPRHAGWIKGSTYYQWEGSDEIFVEDPVGHKHALTFDEWKASGFKPFSKRTNQGFVKLSWDNNIAFLHDFRAGNGGPISYSRWASEGFPKPYVANSFPGDTVYKFCDATIWYAGPTVNRPINGAEWAALGYRTPEMRGSNCQPAPPPRPIGVTQPVDSWNCPASHPIKGNRPSMIFHVRGQAFYNRTNPEQCFATEADARNAGYRKAER